MPYIPSPGFPSLGEQSSSRRPSVIGSLPIGTKQRPAVDITLQDGQSKTFVPSYTTLDKIQGQVTMVCPVDTKYENIHIIFQGATKTFVEKIATHAPTTPRTQAYHNFLRLTQPMDRMDLPEDKILRANVEYKFPFTFVVPEKLLPQACNHKLESPLVQEAHLHLPPSLGDPMMASDGKHLLDDMAPVMTTISYAIRVVVTKPPKESGARPAVLADSMKKLRIVPALEEQPPLRVSDTNEDDYVLEKSKTLKKGIFKGKHGLLTATTTQPAPLRLPYLNSESTGRVTTMATVDVRFDPAEAKSKPPRLGNLWARLKTATFFATTPMKDFPRKSAHYLYDTQRGIYVETLPLAGRCVASAQWTKHDAPARRDSAISISDAVDTSPSDNVHALPYYTTRILVPIDLPTHSKCFLPTFHSCLVSRVYALDMNLSAHAPSSSVGSNVNLHLKVPIQIASEANPHARPVISADEAASIARREADERFFVPRSVAPPPAPPLDDRDYSSPAAFSAAAAASSPDMRGARGSIFVSSPTWSSSGSNSNGGGGSIRSRSMSPGDNGSSSRRGSETLLETLRAIELDEDDNVDDDNDDDDDDQPPGYTAFSGISNRSSAGVTA